MILVKFSEVDIKIKMHLLEPLQILLWKIFAMEDVGCLASTLSISQEEQDLLIFSSKKVKLDDGSMNEVVNMEGDV